MLFTPDLLITLSNDVHYSWKSIILNGLHAIFSINNQYLSILNTHNYLPTERRLFAAFTQPLDAVRYILIGESPYPRVESAIGICFIDGAVNLLWSQNGLSTTVNKATSLRNFIKMLLVAEKKIDSHNSKNNALIPIANAVLNNQSNIIQTLTDLKNNLFTQGFLLLNASLIFRENIKKIEDAKAWRPFLKIIFQALTEHAKVFKKKLPTVILLGKIAKRLHTLPEITTFPVIIAEHPYNLTFIKNKDIQQLFGPMHLLEKFY